jgi:hypothetical protein
MKDNRYLAYGPAYAGKMGKPVQPGDTVKSFRGEEAVIETWEKPRNLNSSGRVYVREPGQQGEPSSFYPSVYNLEWAGSIELDGKPELEQPTYKIVRSFLSDDKANEVVARGLTLKEAQGHCKSPETSSRTCTLPENQKITAEHGEWFDGYEKE